MRVFLQLCFAITLIIGLAASPLAEAFSIGSNRPASFADLSEKLLPAVVNISTTQARAESPVTRDFQFPPGSPFEDMFRQFFEQQLPPGFMPRNYVPGSEPELEVDDNQSFIKNIQARRRLPKASSLGSGFIVSANGFVVTNSHVIANADEITVILTDKTEYRAKVVGIDKKTDLAVLKIQPKRPLEYVKFGDSDTARVGDWVLAIGNPFGLGGSVSAGIVSARARNINAGPYDDFIQTDAAINRGNSGGPLFDIDGNVVGISTAIFSPTGGNVGIGFAIPSNLAEPVINQLKQFGRTKRGWLGVEIQEVTKDIAESLGLEKTNGAIVAQATPGGPAAKAGLKSGDVILNFNGIDIKKMRQLPRRVAETPVGEEVDVTYWRDGKQRNTKVTLGELEQAEKELAALGDQSTPDADNSKKNNDQVLGLGFTNITKQLRQQYKINQNVSGVLVTEVNRNSFAAQGGVRPGFILMQVNRRPVKSESEVKALVNAAKKRNQKSILLLFRAPDNSNRFVALPLKDK